MCKIFLTQARQNTVELDMVLMPVKSLYAFKISSSVEFLNQGKCACRICKLVGQHLDNSSITHYYYGDNRFHYRHPWGQNLKICLTLKMKLGAVLEKKLSLEKGFTGLSILHKYFHPLYGFDILNHLVYGVHILFPSML